MRVPKTDNKNEGWGLVRVDWVEKLGDFDFPESVQKAVEKRQREFWAGRLAAVQCLRRLDYVVQPGMIAIGPGREPVFPSGFVGSISHDHEMAIAWVMRSDSARGVGVDLERSERLEGKSGVASKFLNEQEKKLLKTCDFLEADQTLGWALTFSAKESIFKALYGSVGKKFGFSAVTLEGWESFASEMDLECCRLHFKVVEELSPSVLAKTELVVDCRWTPEQVMTYCRFD